MFPGGCAQNRDYGDVSESVIRLDSTARRRRRSASRGEPDRSGDVRRLGIPATGFSRIALTVILSGSGYR